MKLYVDEWSWMDVEVLNLDVDEFRRVLNEYRIEVEDE